MTDTTPGGRRPPSDQDLDKFVPDVRRGREARLGIFVIFGILSFVTVLFLLTDPATMRGRYMVHTVVDDAGGVRRGDPIQMRGVNIGRLNRFAMRDDGRVEMRLEIEGEWPIPVGSITRLGAAGMFGGRTVEIVPSDATTFYSAGDTLPGEGGRAGGILGSMDDLSGQAGEVMTRIENLLAPETVGSVQGSARELESLLSELSGVVEEQRGTLGDLTASLRRSAEGLEQATAAGPDVASAIARADSVMATLNETSAALDGALGTLRSILDKIDRGEGTLGMLVHDETLYTNLTNASGQLTAFLEDIQANPSKYINLSIF